ncbi:MAG: TIGR04149 family rSAM-modified RiPP [Prevotellaceae bacterium]|nr:TIGR04149 family rSAM-modified RiPP [Prevotellaceae bacterium]
MKKIKLNTLAQNAMNEKEMNDLKGGQAGIIIGDCFCACRYANCGGSGTNSNGGANNIGGLSSPPDIDALIVNG